MGKKNHVYYSLLNDYDIDQESVNVKRKQIETQKYVCDKMKEKGIEGTDVERLIDLLREDSHTQYDFKTSLENRAGFITALWSAISVVIMDKDVIKTLYTNYIDKHNIMPMILLGAIIISMVVSLFFIIKVLKNQNYCTLQFSNKDEILHRVVDDKEASTTQLLDSLLNVWEFNEKVVDMKAKNMNYLIASMSVFIVCIIISFITVSIF